MEPEMRVNMTQLNGSMASLSSVFGLTVDLTMNVLLPHTSLQSCSLNKMNYPLHVSRPGMMLKGAAQQRPMSLCYEHPRMSVCVCVCVHVSHSAHGVSWRQPVIHREWTTCRFEAPLLRSAAWNYANNETSSLACLIHFLLSRRRRGRFGIGEVLLK